MAYTKTDWAEGVTPVNEANLDKIEAGIFNAHSDIAALTTRMSAEEALPDLPTVVNNKWLKGVGGAAVWADIVQTDVAGLLTDLSSKIDKALFDAKGDLIVATAADTAARLPAGANGHVLTADTSLPAGVKWAAAAAGGADLSYDGDWVAGTYQDGDVVVKDGVAYLCVGGPTTAAPDINPWGAARVPVVGDEMAYAELAADLTIPVVSAASAVTVTTLPPLTLDGVTTILLDFSCPFVNAPSGTYVIFDLYDGSTLLGTITQSYGQTQAWAMPVYGRRRLTPSAGTHTYTIKAYSTSIAAGILWSSGARLPTTMQAKRTLPVPPTVTAGTPTNVTYGTSLPASPADGQEAILVDNVANPSYQWRFRFNAGSSSAYKWELVGGTPRSQGNLPVAAAGFSNTAFADLAGGPTFVIPRAGDYTISFGCGLQTAQAGSTDLDVRTFDGTTGGPQRVYVTSVQTYQGGTVSAVERRDGMAAGATLRLQIKSTAALSNLSNNGYLSVIPVRVA